MDYNNIFILIIKYGIFFCFTTAIAQVNLIGTIKNKKGENMPDINIILKRKYRL
ncbi:hypothetical protein FACS1894174_03180 [Bacteroidia bacterium]|nr:hypothetical protein FACS1894174_03180 [Bacteroidia bacterium]